VRVTWFGHIANRVVFVVNSVKSSGQNPQAAGLQQLNDTMVYFGGGGGSPQSSGATTTSAYSSIAAAVFSVAAVALAALL
jgi:hypothetical protein